MAETHYERADVLEAIRSAFKARDPDYKVRRREREERFDAVWRAGSVCSPISRCAVDLRTEVTWLIHYRDCWPAIDAKIDQLAEALKDRSEVEKGQGSDGSWSSCLSEWFTKLEPTVDALQTDEIVRICPQPLTFMVAPRDFQSPEVLLGYLFELQISDIAATGRNNRAELGAVQTALSQLIFKDEIRDLLEDPRWGFEISDQLEDAYRDYLRQTQNPRTGFWGPWYRFGDRLVMVQDLSFTFHQVNYLSGNVDRWSQIVDTTLAIRDLVYPMGWRQAPGAYCNHHNYDVAMIFSLGWPHMSRRQKRDVSLAIFDLLSWCLTSGLSEQGLGKDAPTVEAHYFCVRFLDTVGFFDPAKKFWRQTTPLPAGLPNPRSVANELEAVFAGIDDGSEMAETVSAILRAATFRAGEPDAGS